MEAFGFGAVPYMLRYDICLFCLDEGPKFSWVCMGAMWRSFFRILVAVWVLVRTEVQRALCEREKALQEKEAALGEQEKQTQARREIPEVIQQAEKTQTTEAAQLKAQNGV